MAAGAPAQPVAVKTKPLGIREGRNAKSSYGAAAVDGDLAGTLRFWLYRHLQAENIAALCASRLLRMRIACTQHGT